MTNATNNVARVAAAVAGLGLVAMSFAPFVGAQTTTTTTTTTTSASFTRDLTVGSTGADVTALQTWLISKGFSIPAGATGYFGAQTKAAVAAFQAANAITPAAGYFGPITRAKVAALGGSSSSTGLPAGCTSTAGFSPTTGASCSGGGSTSTGALSGGEADLRNFDLVAGDDLMEGDSNTEIALAKFDVSGGDARIQRVTVEVQPTLSSASANQHPWSYVDSLSVYDGSKKVGSIDAGSKDDWDNQNDDSDHTGLSGADYYSIDIPVDTIVREGDSAELSVRADAQSSIDTADQDQTFKLDIPDNGIRAVDSDGIQQYTGDVADAVSFGFNAAQNGDLTISETSDNPDAQVLVTDTSDTSDDYDVLAFQIKNKDDSGVDFNSLTFTVATTSAASTTGAANITTIVRRATLDLDGDTYTGDINSNNTIKFDNLDTSVNGNDTIDATLTISLFGSNNHYATAGESLTFNLTNGNVDAEGSDTGDASDVSGTVSGNKMTVGGDAGISVAGNSNSTSESYNSTTPANSTGTFILKFDVTASGDDVYVPKSIAAVSSTTAPSNTTSGVVVITDLAASTTNATSVSASLSATADTDPSNSSFYVVHDGDTETFTANVTIDPLVAGYYQVGLDKIHFTNVAAGTGTLQTLDTDENDSDFQTDQQFIH